jgi:hypothetical protein
MALFLIIFQSNTFSQTSTIKSRVLDKSTEEPLFGANILIDGTSLGAPAILMGDYN